MFLSMERIKNTTGQADKMISRALTLFCVLLITAACSEESSAPETSDAASGKTTFAVETVADELVHPWSLAFLPTGDYLVTERRGKLLRVDAETGHKTEIRGVPSVYAKGQGGLLDIVLEPGFSDGGRVYFSYAATNEEDKGNTEVARATLNLTQNSLSDLQVIFKAKPKVTGANHWGSRLLFAPDGTLYVTLGERYDYKEQAQDPSNHLGAIVRLNPDGSVPANNPLRGEAGALPEIYSYGHRNPQGIALHPDTQNIWIHEHGPQGGDEINILKPGANYGWPAVTFGISYWGTEISDKTSAPGMEDPILHWTPSIAPSGMAFYTGDRFPNWKGDLFVGALAGQHLRRLELDGQSVTEEEKLLEGRGSRIRDVRNGPDGYLYLLTDEPDGKILRLTPASDAKSQAQQ